jgi:hypothetical protein
LRSQILLQYIHSLGKGLICEFLTESPQHILFIARVILTHFTAGPCWISVSISTEYFLCIDLDKPTNLLIMSAEAEVSEALSKPVEQTAASTEQVKEVVKEVERYAGDKKEAALEESNEHKTNGASDHKDDSEANKENGDNDKRDKRSDRRRGDRFEGRGRGHRGRGGRGGFSRGGRHNIKSDLTTQEESDDPVEIRRQVFLTSPQLTHILTQPPG